MTKAKQCHKCKGKGATKVAMDEHTLVPAGAREKGAYICNICMGSGWISEPEQNVRASQIVDELTKKPKKPSYPSWFEDQDQ